MTLRQKALTWITAAACMTLAACSAPEIRTAPASRHPAASTVAPAARPPHAALPPGVSLSPQAGSLPPGPLVIKAISCGLYTAAQRRTFGTTALGGLTYSYTGRPGTKGDGAVLDVEFLKGSHVIGENVSGDPPPVAAGQTATGSVDALSGSGGNITFTGCELVDYAVTTAAGAQPGRYAP